MHKQLQVWKLVSRSLQRNVPVMLLYVLDSVGSSPGRADFCMAVNAVGEIVGSIGGGIMEHKFVETAKEKLKSNEDFNKIYKQIHDKSSLKFQSGMICSGEQINLLYKVKHADIEAITRIVNCLEKKETGAIILSKKGIDFSEETLELVVPFEFHDEDEMDWKYEKEIGYKNTLRVIGAGHCSLALTEIMCRMNFYIYLYENRENLSTFQSNHFVDEKVLLQDYSKLKIIEPFENDYAVVMTVGYKTDDTVVRALMDKSFKYLGVLGSKKKIEKMFADYRNEGISEEVLSRIHAPIGIQINSQTPEEIAISIAAEIIKVKNE